MNTQEDDIQWLSVPLSAETRRRLAALADSCHSPDPAAIAASLLHDVLADDEAADPLAFATHDTAGHC